MSKRWSLPAYFQLINEPFGKLTILRVEQLKFVVKYLPVTSIAGPVLLKGTHLSVNVVAVFCLILI